MLVYKGTYKNGKFIWDDIPPNLDDPQQEFNVIFLQKKQSTETGRYNLSKDGEKRIGFMQGECTVPDDIHWSDDEILRMFGFSEEEIAEEMKGWQRSSD